MRGAGLLREVSFGALIDTGFPRDHIATVAGHAAEVGGQKSEVRSRRSEAGPALRSTDFRPPTSELRLPERMEALQFDA